MQPSNAKRVEYVPSGQEGLAHRSRSAIQCTLCGQRIPVGAYYTRRALPVTGTVFVVCPDCRPFRSLPQPAAAETDATLA